MSAAVFAEPYKFSAGLLALLVHAVFFTLLFLGFSWQHQQPQGMVVDIWESLPQNEVAQPVTAAPQPLHEETPVPPKPQVQAAPAKPEIALPGKKKNRKQKEDRDEPVAKLTRKQLAAQKAEYAKWLQQEKAQQEQEAARQAQVQAEAAAIGKVVDEFRDKISAKIRRNIVSPPGVNNRISAEFDVTLLPGGQLLESELRLTRSSGNGAYDSAVERAILKSQPLPLPPDPALFGRFRNLHLKFSPD
ncbi:MAG TPA: cell envelope integrity protein TolA [Gallionellaceae bacterium]|nr:cell envelope integrity protein TolA [Gallionellaceae bacterium]